MNARIKKALAALVLGLFALGPVVGMGAQEEGDTSPRSLGNQNESADSGGGTEPAVDEEIAQNIDADLPSPQDLSASFRQVANTVINEVVEVRVVNVVEQQTPTNPFEFFFGPDEGQQQQQEERRVPGLGSGVIVRRDGDTVYIVTNNHVVGEAEEITIVLTDDREFDASIVGTDARTDLALLEMSTSEEVPMATLGDSSELAVGDWVLAIGNPLGFDSTVTAGIVSALGRQPGPGTPISGYTDFIQTDAAINRGNSGGSLVDMNGNVIGINSWIASPGRSGGSIGLGFAIPANLVRRAITDFIEEGRIIYGWLGVSVQSLDANAFAQARDELEIGDATGTLVANVHTDSPAAGNLLPGDFITGVNGESIESGNELTRAVGDLRPGADVSFDFIRYGRQEQTTVTLEARPAEEELQQAQNLWPGFAVTAITDDIRDQLGAPGSLDGVIVAQVAQGTPAAVTGFRPGDVIVAVDGTEVPRLLDFFRELNDGNRHTLDVLRQGRQVRLGLRRP